MTNTQTGDQLAPTYRGMQWGRAIKALIGLGRNTEDTQQVFEIIEALSGDTLERTYREFIQTEDGQQLLVDKPSLMAVLLDRERLASLPEGSLGRAYLDFMIQGNITADGLVAAQTEARANEQDLGLDPDRQYVSERLRDQHDLWHVLTDYGMDDAGEIANLWFSVGQFGNPGMAFIAFFGGLDGLDLRMRWPLYLYRAYKRGRVARKLVSVPFEQLLVRNIHELRAELGITPTPKCHPRGIRYGNRKDIGMGRGVRQPGTLMLAA